MEEDVGRARRIGAGIMADDGVEPEQRLDQIVAEIAAKDIGRRLGEEIDQMPLLLEPEPPDPAAELQEREQVAQAAAGIGRRAQQPLPEHPDDAVERGGIGVVMFGVGRRMAGNLGPRQPAPAREQVVGTLRGQEIVDFPQHHLEAVLVEPHVADDLGVEQGDRVGRGRVPEAGMEFLGHRRPADHRARFEHGDRKAALGEVEGAGERIVPRADDQDVACHGRAIGGGPVARQCGRCAPGAVAGGISSGKLPAAESKLLRHCCPASVRNHDSRISKGGSREKDFLDGRGYCGVVN